MHLFTFFTLHFKHSTGPQPYDFFVFFFYVFFLLYFFFQCFVSTLLQVKQPRRFFIKYYYVFFNKN